MRQIDPVDLIGRKREVSRFAARAMFS